MKPLARWAELRKVGRFTFRWPMRVRGWEYALHVCVNMSTVLVVLVFTLSPLLFLVPREERENWHNWKRFDLGNRLWAILLNEIRIALFLRDQMGEMCFAFRSDRINWQAFKKHAKCWLRHLSAQRDHLRRLNLSRPVPLAIIFRLQWNWLFFLFLLTRAVLSQHTYLIRAQGEFWIQKFCWQNHLSKILIKLLAKKRHFLSILSYLIIYSLLIQFNFGHTEMTMVCNGGSQKWLCNPLYLDSWVVNCLRLESFSIVFPILDQNLSLAIQKAWV